jgi:hypothetical protein
MKKKIIYSKLSFFYLKIYTFVVSNCNRVKGQKNFYPLKVQIKNFTLSIYPYSITFLPTDLRTYGPTDLRTYGPTDLRTYGPTDLRTYGPTDLRTYGPTDLRREVRKERTLLLRYYSIRREL